MNSILGYSDKKTMTSEAPRRGTVRRRQRVQLTSRDQEIVRWVFSAGLATREQVQRLFFTAGGRSRCQCRLTLLYRQRYLDRLAGRPRNAAAIYYLSRRANRGLQLLRLLEPDRPLDLPPVNPALTEHRLRIADCRIAYLQACAASTYEVATWLDEEEIPRAARADGIVPDAYFQVTRGGTGGERRASFFLEVERSAKSDRALTEKFRRYGDFYYSGRYERELGVKGLRVLFVVGSDYGIDARRRVQKLASLCAKAEVTIFRFVALEDFLAQEASQLLFARIWHRPREEEPSALFER